MKKCSLASTSILVKCPKEHEKTLSLNDIEISTYTNGCSCCSSTGYEMSVGWLCETCDKYYSLTLRESS